MMRVKGGGWIMVLNATFNNIAVILWWAVLLLEKTGQPAEYHRPAGIHKQTLSHNVVYGTPPLSVIRTHHVSDDRH